MSWQRVRGHEHLVQAFGQVVRSGRLAHAYLFVGPSGVGKRLFATELARALLCESPPAHRFDACDHCPACLQVEAGAHPDLFVCGRPDEKHELPINVMRQLGRDLALKPARGRGKVAIIDDADDLNEESANCFLKTLEEPPPRSLLILLGTSPELQLPTIVSRCQVVRFAPLPESLVRELLERSLSDKSLGARVAHLAGGSMGKAVALADPTLWTFRRRLLEGLTAPRIERVKLAEEWNDFVEEAGKDSASQRTRAALMLGLLIDFFNEALAASVGREVLVNDEREQALVRTLADRLTPDAILALLERSLEADLQIDRRAQLGVILEALVDALAEATTKPVSA